MNCCHRLRHSLHTARQQLSVKKQLYTNQHYPQRPVPRPLTFTQSDMAEKVKPEPGTVTGPFDVPDDTTDVTFLIEDKKIYFNRVVLVMASPAFKQAFSACDHKSKGEKLIPLPGKKYVDMVAFLKQIHPAHCAEPITDETLPEILLLADEYEVASVRQKCEEYINTQIRLDVCQPMSDYRVLFYLTVAEKHSFQMLRQQLVGIGARRPSAAVQQSGNYNLVPSTAVRDLMAMRCAYLENFINCVQAKLQNYNVIKIPEADREAGCTCDYNEYCRWCIGPKVMKDIQEVFTICPR
ncbi:hypothetical protein BaRGS_00003725 [Batillaria attramentaria]|uniref:BTB domain-containing protein n=1 Tax=Batillaria attramentaria TaxID=370345 RepID=A0ABD0M0U9_9CAEN